MNNCKIMRVAFIFVENELDDKETSELLVKYGFCLKSPFVAGYLADEEGLPSKAGLLFMQDVNLVH